MGNPNMLREAVRAGDKEKLVHAIHIEKTDPDTDLTPGKLGAISNYTPTFMKGIWAESRDFMEFRALHYIARFGHYRLIEYLVQKGANINIGNYIKNTPLHTALFYNSSEVVKELLRLGANPNIKNTSSFLGGITEEYTPMHYAALYGTPKDIALLSEYGANISTKGLGGVSPLHLAVSIDNIDNAKALIDHGHPVDCFNSTKQTPLAFACYNGEVSAEMVMLLLEHKASLLITDMFGKTAMFKLCNDNGKDSEKQLEKLMQCAYFAKQNKSLPEFVDNLIVVIRESSDTNPILFNLLANLMRNSIDFCAEAVSHQKHEKSVQTEMVEVRPSGTDVSKNDAPGGDSQLALAAASASAPSVSIAAPPPPPPLPLSKFLGTSTKLVILKKKKSQEELAEAKRNPMDELMETLRIRLNSRRQAISDRDSESHDIQEAAASEKSAKKASEFFESTDDFDEQASAAVEEIGAFSSASKSFRPGTGT